MKHKLPYLIFLLLLSISLSEVKVMAQETGVGNLFGQITDKSTGEPLPGATIILEDNSGAVTDLYGEYFLTGVKAGSVKITIRYLGYETVIEVVEVEAQTLNEYNKALSIASGELDEVVVTAQALGQAGAINRQLNSNTIVSIVSKDRIESMPDQNAAESVGRLPGIAIQRDGGEGQKVVVRGLSPRLNSITINGERIPSTDPQNRSVDLSMIAPEQLEGIEVFKSLTPDQDADAIGGTVNFLTKKAPRQSLLGIRAETGYNSIANEYGQYRVNLDAGKRFFDNKLGILLTGNFQRANRSAESYNATYDSRLGFEDVTIASYSLNDNQEVRYRYGGSLAIDYNLNRKGDYISFNSVLGNTERFETRRRRSVNYAINNLDFDLRDRESETALLSNSLIGEHQLPFGIELTWVTSASFTNQGTPFSHRMRFRQFEAFDFNNPEVANLNNGFDIDEFATTDYSEAFFRRGELTTTNTTENIYTAKFDLKYPIKITDDVRGYIKAGAKYRVFDRANDATEFRDNGSGASDGLFDLINDFPNEFASTPSNPQRISMQNFFGNYTNSDFLNNQARLNLPLSVAQSDRFVNFFANDYYFLNTLIDNEDYEALEQIGASYVMSEFNIKNLMILGGVRMEYTNANYVGFETSEVDDDTGGLDGTTEAFRQRNESEIAYLDVLPMLHLRYRFSDFFDVRAAYTQSISRPDFQNLVPWAVVNPFEAEARLGNPGLQHMTAQNFDLFLSYYKDWGLITLGGFYKELKNIDVNSRFIESDRANSLFGFSVEQPINVDAITTVSGVEFDFQANFRELPQPFSNIILSVNATYINTTTSYPLFLREGTSGPPFFHPNFLNTTRPGSLPGQPDLTMNFSLGYEKGRFSTRINMILQDNSFEELGPNEFADSFTDLLVRYDASAKFQASDKFEIFFNWNNISNAPIQAFQFNDTFLTQQEYFGFTMDLGLRFKLRGK